MVVSLHVKKQQNALRQKSFYQKHKQSILKKNKDDRAFLKIHRNQINIPPQNEPVIAEVEQPEQEPEQEVKWNLATLVDGFRNRQGVKDTTRRGDVATITRLYTILGIDPEDELSPILTDYERVKNILTNLKKKGNEVIKPSYLLKFLSIICVSKKLGMPLSDALYTEYDESYTA